ncbi:nucleotide-binding universal stress UspA family protein [Nocardia transvalensis]|uniref:Nucleotide-binding universal stress UspA family protein n=1 Tax=Nocardia transvalensis TaxID=37333 RepID=A0A7W9PIG0_9NOCA|nr:universal stress protein [Nocardia transvalensis]MBB5916701.1 nucleotide-binding universal stress UspA family protein [Nocardia transvalensis]
MKGILVRPSETALQVAHAMSAVLRAEVRAVPHNVSDDDFLRALAGADVTAGVVELDGGGWRILQRATTPVVLVPARVRPGPITRVLVPLDGSDEAVHAVAETVRLFRAAGVVIIVLHVFDRGTVPAYWDQAAHAREAWEDEFLARYCSPHFPGPAPAVTLRSGHPGENVVDVAAEQADLIILGWSRNLLPGRAETVRRTVADATVPVLLIPD